jgi:hypothetical protein
MAESQVLTVASRYASTLEVRCFKERGLGVVSLGLKFILFGVSSRLLSDDVQILFPKFLSI